MTRHIQFFILCDLKSNILSLQIVVDETPFDPVGFHKGLLEVSHVTQELLLESCLEIKSGSNLIRNTTQVEQDHDDV